MKIFYSYIVVLFFAFQSSAQTVMVPFSIDWDKRKYLTIYDKVIDDYIPLFIKGVNLGSAVPGSWPGQLEVSSEQYARWFRMMTDAGFNTVRIYTLHFPRFYEELARYNVENPDNPLYLMHGIWLREEYPTPFDEGDLYSQTDLFDKEIRYVIDCIHGKGNIPQRPGEGYGVYKIDVSQWVIGYIIGREIMADEVIYTNWLHYNKPSNYYGAYVSIENASPTEIWVTERIDKLIAYEISNYKTTRPVANSSWPTLDPISHESEEPGSGEDDAQIDMSKLILTKENVPGGHFISYHAYPYYPNFMNDDPAYKIAYDDEGVNNYLGYLRELKEHYEGKYPLLITEFGVPSSYTNAFTSISGMNHGGMTEEEQGRYVMRMFKNIYDTDCGGGIVFSWMDEWFKRTWINDPTYTNRRNLWHNLCAAENNFGLIRFAPSPVFYSSRNRQNVTMTKVSSVERWHDFATFNVNVALRSSLKTGDTIWIAFDTYDRDKGESTLPNGKRVINNRAEFLLRITADSANLYVTKAYDLFGLSLRMCESNAYQTTATDGEPWHLLRWRDGAQGYLGYPHVTDIGKLNVCFGNAVPKTHQFVHIKDDVISIRLPWTLLNFNDPSMPTVIDDNTLQSYNNCNSFLACRYTNLTGSLTNGVALTLIYNNEVAALSTLSWRSWDLNNQQILNPHMSVEVEKESFEIIKEGLNKAPFVYLQNDDNAWRPVITQQPVGASLYPDDLVTLSVSAFSPDGGQLRYQWFKNNANNQYGYDIIPGAVETTYTPNTETEGTNYYYVRVINTNDNVVGIKTVSLNSAAAVIKVSKPSINAWISSGLLHVTGLNPGDALNIYSITGALVYKSIATSREMDIPLRFRGLYIVQSGNNAVKVVYY